MPTDKHPGRPTPSDEKLLEIRDRLVPFLSVWWAEIAWQLRQATTPEMLRKALEPLKGRGKDDLISHFVMSSSTTTTGKELRATKRAHDKAVANIPEVDEKYKEVARLHSQIKAAMTEANPDQLQVLQGDLAKYETELKYTADKLDAATKLERDLKTCLDDQRASFAQGELAKIVMERRCALHPLKLANAMAGLPSLSARVSYGRCAKFKCRVWPTFEFRRVQFIESTWNRRSRYPRLSPVELFDQEIKRLSKTVRRDQMAEVIAFPADQKWVENPLRTYLGERRRYLRLAIEKSLNTPNIEEGQMPFVIACNFSAILEEPRSTLTEALAERERIDK